MSPDDPRHGTVAGYNAHRKNAVEPCADCRRAMATYGARLAWDHMNGRRRVVDATGTARRIQALVFLGYTFGDIGDALGVSHDVARHYAVTRSTVRTATADSVSKLYERWSMSPAPDSKRSKYARTNALRRGWVGPLSWDDIDHDDLPTAGGVAIATDSVVVARIVAGDSSLARNATVPERRAVVASWPGSLAELDRLTGWRSDRYIDRQEGAA